MAANKLRNLHVRLRCCRRKFETDAIIHDESEGKSSRPVPSKGQNCTTILLTCKMTGRVLVLFLVTSPSIMVGLNWSNSSNTQKIKIHSDRLFISHSDLNWKWRGGRGKNKLKINTVNRLFISDSDLTWKWRWDSKCQRCSCYCRVYPCQQASNFCYKARFKVEFI